jgi:hypothetical protein
MAVPFFVLSHATSFRSVFSDSIGNRPFLSFYRAFQIGCDFWIDLIGSNSSGSMGQLD